MPLNSAPPSPWRKRTRIDLARTLRQCLSPSKCDSRTKTNDNSYWSHPKEPVRAAHRKNDAKLRDKGKLSPFVINTKPLVMLTLRLIQFLDLSVMLGRIFCFGFVYLF